MSDQYHVKFLNLLTEKPAVSDKETRGNASIYIATLDEHEGPTNETNRLKL